MAVKYEEIEPEITKLRDFVLNDLGAIVDQRGSGNYAAIAVIVCACDALSRLRYGRKDNGLGFFTEYMLPEKWRRVGNSLYDALRNGIIHGYETKVIHIKKCRLEIGVSKKKYPHLCFSDDRGSIYVNIQQMKSDLKAAFVRYESELQSCPDLRNRFHRMFRKSREKPIKNLDELCAWQLLLSEE